MQPARPTRFWPVAAFVVLAAAANMWASHHYGIGIRNPGKLALAVSSIAAALTLLGWLVDKEEQQAAGARVRTRLRFLFSAPMLAILYGALVLLTLSRSSIEVVGERGATPGFRVEALDADGAFRRDELATTAASKRIPVPIRPFGRLFRVDVHGYLPAIVEVPPFTGARIVAGRDALPAPMLLVRPSPIVLRSLRSGGAFRLWRVDAQAGEELLADVPGSDDTGAFLVGHDASRGSVPTELRTEWRLELTAEGHDPGTVSKLLLAWSRPVFVPLDRPLEPGMKLRVEVRTRADSPRPAASREIYLSPEPLVDLPLLEDEP